MITFDHVHLFCTDLEGMIKFWNKCLDAAFIKYRKFGPADGAVMDLAGTQIFLKVVPEDAAQPNGAARGLNHLGIRVSDPDVMAEKMVEEFGCKLLNRPNENYCFVAHPDGLVFEIMRRGAEI